MNIIRVSELWQVAAVYFIRTRIVREVFHAPIHREFSEDDKESEYILVMEGEDPVSTCRIRQLDATTGKIERVATLPEAQGKRYGAAAIQEAEAWLREKGCQRICINSRTAVVGFYEKLGYVKDLTQVTGEGTFQCVMTWKDL